MRRFLALLALLLALPAAVAAEEGESRTFGSSNFKLTLPSDDWSFRDVDAGQKSAGYVVQVDRRVNDQAYVQAHVRVVPTNKLSLAEMCEEVRAQIAGQYVDKLQKSGVTAGKLSGLDGSAVVLQGTAKTGAKFWFRGYMLSVKGTFHQLLIQAWNGAESEVAREIDALRRGYRLLDGAGAEEPAPDEGDDLGGESAAPEAAGEEWPPGGPKREGATAIFPSHNLRWTLPEGSPFRWTGVTAEEASKDVVLIIASAEFPRKAKREGEPDRNTARVLLSVAPLPEGWTPENVVNNPGNHDSVNQSFFHGKADAGRTKIDPDVMIGNVSGGRFLMAGPRGERTTGFFLLYCVALKAERYVWDVQIEGGGDAMDAFKDCLQALMKGVHFVDTTEPVRGPMGVNAVAAATTARGIDVGKETEVNNAPGLKAKKPKDLAEVVYQPEADPGLRFAWETRSADGQAYLYFDVHRYTAKELADQKRSIESIVTDRETDWKTASKGDSVTVAKGKEPHYKDTFGAGKGVGYRFRGNLGDIPYVEQGWVVEAKQAVFWIRVQFGGKDAEKTMDPVFKGIKKALKLEG
jgi:hypothetical protein